MPFNEPGLWTRFLTWLYNHRNETGYAALAGSMAVLRGVYFGEESKTRLVIDAAICSMFAFFLEPTLQIIRQTAGVIFPLLDGPVSVGIARALSVFLGFLGTQFISTRLRGHFNKKSGDE